MSTITLALSVGILGVSACIMGAILFYVFALRKIPMYKMRRKTIFNMIFDDFDLEKGSRFHLLFFLFFFCKRIIYSIILCYLANTALTPLNLYIFVVCIVPMLYFSYALPFKWVGLNSLLCLNEFSEMVIGVVLLHY